jgi:hypothetical protein
MPAGVYRPFPRAIPRAEHLADPALRPIFERIGGWVAEFDGLAERVDRVIPGDRASGRP